MKIAILISNYEYNRRFILKKLEKLNITKSDIILSDDNEIVMDFAKDKGIQLRIFYPDPDLLSPKRYYDRNEKLALVCDKMIVFNNDDDEDLGDDFDDPETHIPSIQTINDKSPSGVCGSGILDSIAELLKVELIDSRGKFKAENNYVYKDDKGELQYILEPSFYDNGNSKDKTLEIIKNELKNSDVESRIFTENKGLGYARELVVKNAKGKYIVWVDSDMILPKDFVKKQVEFMESHPDVGIAKGKYASVEENSLVATLENVTFLVAFQHGKNEANLFPLGTSGCIYRVEAIRQAGGFDENISGVGEDMDVEYRVKMAGWKLSLSSAIFLEKRRRTWHSLWDEYLWHGKGAAHLYKKNKRILFSNRNFLIFYDLKEKNGLNQQIL